MPNCVLEQARKELLLCWRSFSGLACGILGMAFKPNNDDFRESLAFKLRRLLLWEGAEVFCSDAHMQRSDFVSAAHLLERCNVVFIGCPHKDYRQLTFRT